MSHPHPHSHPHSHPHPHPHSLPHQLQHQPHPHHHLPPPHQQQGLISPMQHHSHHHLHHPYQQMQHQAVGSQHPAASSPSSWTNRGPPPHPQHSSSAQGSAGCGLGSSASSSQGGENKYVCPNCGKAFGRDDLLRRHLSREARALAQPQFDRQKSCYECARSKARCDLEVPSCGRCRARGKQCMYGARSGNPNVRRQRDSMLRESMGPAPAAASHSAQSMAGSSDGHYMGQWNMSIGSTSDAAYQSDSSHNSQTPGSRHSGDDDKSESGLSWSDSGHGYNAGPHSYPSSSGPDTSMHSGDFSIGPHDAIEQGNLVTPTSYLARHGIEASMQPPPPPPPPAPLHGSTPSTTRITTDLDRSRSAFKTEDGEETPIGRMVSAFAAGSSSVATSGSGVDADSRTKAAGSTGGMSGTWSNVNGNASAPYGQQGTLGGMASVGSMGPPPLSGARLGSYEARNRPQPHRLLTGANMPQPPQTQSTSYLASGKPLFSAMVDISGWLEEPVVPSPLYPTGPSLAPFGATIPLNGEGALEASQTASGTQQQQSQTARAPAQDNNMMQGVTGSDGQNTQPQMPASRYWWANPPSQSDYNLMQGVAQATANHLSHYSHLMVLPDPSSPVPPTVHRPWIATIRGNIPAPLAIARVLLAGYAVRLPASEPIVWESIARETQRLIHAHEALCTDSSPDLDVFGATQALFFYCILLMMCNDAGAVGHVDVSLTNSAFFGLSQLAKTLSTRVQAAQRRRHVQNASGGGGKSRTDWMQWGCEETMRRSVWAAYAMLVLQRYRDSADMSEGRMAGVDLILDLELPAVALEFEAGSQEEWAKARAAISPNAAPALTFRDLLRFRPNGNARTGAGGTPDEKDHSSAATARTTAGAAGPPPQGLLDYFERHDAFVATVLSIAFCLDTGIGS